MNKKFFNQKGVSLTELVITLALLSVILGIGYGFYFFGTRAFATGESQSNIQQSIRLTADFISREIRTAHVMEILGSGFTVPATDSMYSYIFIDPATGELTYQERGSARRNILGGIADDAAYALNFQRTGTDGNLLFLRIAGDFRGRNHDIESEILLENLSSIAIHTASGATTAGGGVAIRYSTPSPPSPTIKTVSINPMEKFVDQDVSITVHVSTSHVNNLTFVRAQMFHPDTPGTIISSSSGSIFSNSATLTLPAPTTMALGAYKVEVNVAGVIFPHTRAFLVIVEE